MATPIKFEHSDRKITKPHFYDDPKFLERKFREFGIAGAIEAIKQQFRDVNQQDQLAKLTDNAIVERVYSQALVNVWTNIIKMEETSGKRMQGLMMNFVNSQPEMLLRVMGAEKKVTHRDFQINKISNDNGVTKVYSHCIFVPIEDIIMTVMKIRNEPLSDLISKANEELEIGNKGNILEEITEVCKGIIAENNPICVTWCIDTVLTQQVQHKTTGEILERELKYSMNYSEFPNGKCVKSSYVLINTNDIANCPDENARKSLMEMIKKQSGPDSKAFHVSVADAVISFNGGKKNCDDLMKNHEDFKKCIQLFKDHSVMEQIKKVSADSISQVCDDLFMIEANKHDEISNYRFYLYETKDYMIYELSQTNPETDIKAFLDSLS